MRIQLNNTYAPPYYVVVCAVLFVRRIELKRRLQYNLKINKHKSNSLIPPQPKQGGSETKPSWGRLQPNRRLERDLFRKGGTTAWVRDGFFNKKAVTNDTKSVTTWCRRWDLNPHELTFTGFWDLSVCLFRHFCKYIQSVFWRPNIISFLRVVVNKTIFEIFFYKPCDAVFVVRAYNLCCNRL